MPEKAGDDSPDVWAALADRVDPLQWRPHLAPDIELAEREVSSGAGFVMAGNPRDLVHYRLTLEEAALLPLLDGEHTIAEIVVDRLSADGGFDVASVVELAALLEQGGYLTSSYVDVAAALERAVHPPTLRRRIGGFAKTLTVEWPEAERLVRFLYRHALRHVFTRIGLILSALVTLCGVAAFVDVVSRHAYRVHNRHFGVTFVILIVSDLLIIFVHELGHAAVLVHYGRRVKSAGFRIYFGAPSFFIESSDALMLPRGRRIIQAAAGPGLESVGTSIAAIVLWALPTGTAGTVIYQFVIINYFVLFLNLVPFLELDGYWILSDWLRQPDLRPESLGFVRHEMWRKLRRRERFTRREIGLAGYGTLGVAFTIAAFVSAWFFWRRVFGDSLLAMWHAGALGKVLLLLVILLFAGPVLRALYAAVRGIIRAVGARLDAWRFRRQSNWRIEAAQLLDESGTFGDVPVDVLNDLAGRVRLRPVPRGAVLIRQGEPADAFYVTRSGRLEVLEETGDGREPLRLRLIGRGEGFGEFGLLEGAPRTATVRAMERSEVFEIDKSTFGRLLAGRAAFDGFASTWQQATELAAMAPFAHLPETDLRSLAAHGSWMNVPPGQAIMSQGETGDTFFVIESGQFDIDIDGTSVRSRGPGEHVGELALLLDQPRNATVRALTPARVFALDRDGFTAFAAAAFRRGAVTTNVPATLDWDH
jgi:putative peptide zinc metalloprotease protein